MLVVVVAMTLMRMMTMAMMILMITFCQLVPILFTFLMQTGRHNSA